MEMDDGGKVPMEPGFDVRLAIENLRKIIVQMDKLPDDCSALQAAEHGHEIEVDGKLDSATVFDTKNCKACGATMVILLLEDFLNQRDAYRINHTLAETAASVLRSVRPAFEKYAAIYEQYAPVAAEIHKQAIMYSYHTHDCQRRRYYPLFALVYLRRSIKHLETVAEIAKENVFYDEIYRQPGLRPVKRLLSEAELMLHEYGFRDSEIAEILPDDLGKRGRLGRIRIHRNRLREQISKQSVT